MSLPPLPVSPAQPSPAVGGAAPPPPSVTTSAGSSSTVAAGSGAGGAFEAGSMSGSGEDDDVASFKVKCSLCGHRFSIDEIADHSAVCDATFSPSSKTGGAAASE